MAVPAIYKTSSVYAVSQTFGVETIFSLARLLVVS